MKEYEVNFMVSPRKKAVELVKIEIERMRRENTIIKTLQSIDIECESTLINYDMISAICGIYEDEEKEIYLDSFDFFIYDVIYGKDDSLTAAKKIIDYAEKWRGVEYGN